MADDSKKVTQTISSSTTPAKAEVAKSDADRSEFNTLVLFRKLVIQVLDIRSLDPVKNEPVDGVWISKLDGSDRVPVARYSGYGKDWPVDKYFPIYPSGSSYKHGTVTVDLGKASQMALDALGFDVGGPTSSYGDQGKTAFLRYRLERGIVKMSAEDLAKFGLPAKVKLAASDLETRSDGSRVLKGATDTDGKPIEFRAPTSDEMKDPILKEYNTQCYYGAQFHLAALGFYPGSVNPLDDNYFDAKEGGTWSDEWTKACHQWQKTKLGYSTPFDWIKRQAEGKKLLEAAKNFVTDDQGCLNVPVPVSRIAEGFRIEVSFGGFAIVAESTKKEADDKKADAIQRTADTKTPHVPLPQFDGPHITWDGPLNKATWDGSEQKANTNLDGDVGWRWSLRHGTGSTRRARQLRTSWVFEIPACPWKDGETVPTWSIVQDKHKAFSVYFGPSSLTAPQLVLLAMRWCQPVYDEFGDPLPSSGSPTVSENSYNWQGADPRDGNLHMHVVTQFYDLGGTSVYGGKGYGQFEHDVPGPTKWRGGDGHHGIDVHAAVGAPIFAVHAGKASYAALGSSNDIGNITNLVWPTVGGKRGKIGYGHLKDKVGASPRNVRSGEIVAVAGRTGNLSAVSDQAGHSHLNIGAVRNDLRDTPDDANKCCIPANESTPLLFPCKCETTQNGDALRNCQFTNDKIVSDWRGGVASVCWAVAELCCPHMPRSVTADQLEADGDNAVKARRCVQAQLRKLGYYYPDPSSGGKSAKQMVALDGDFGGKIEDTVNATTNGNIRASTTTTSDVVGSATSGQAYTWHEVSSDGKWIRISIPEASRKDGHKDVETGWAYKTVVELPKLGLSRQAIYDFKNAEKLLSSAGPASDNYRLSSADLARLNQKAPLLSIQGSAM